MANKYFEGHIKNTNTNEDIDEIFISGINQLKLKCDKYIDDLQISKVLEDIFDILRASNKYIDDTTPWVLSKDPSLKNRLETVLYNLLEAIRVTNILLRPFMPDSTDKVISYLKTDKNEFNDAFFIENIEYSVIPNAEPLFQRIQKQD